MATPLRDDKPKPAKPDLLTESGLTPDDMSVELSSRRTGMSFQRTRMSADRTLMSVIRTALSLISFGFTIYQFFEHLVETKLMTGSGAPARNFGAALIVLGVLMLLLGIGYHVAFMLGLRRERALLAAEKLIHAESGFPASMTLIVALLLLVVGVLAIASLILRAGPFD
jgi:inner membrane protein YidH